MTADPHAASPSPESEGVSSSATETASAAESSPPVQPAPEAIAPETAAPAAETSGDASAESSKPRIRIGTQRPGVAVPRVEPRAKVAFRTVPGQGAAPGGAPQQPIQHQPVERPPSHEQYPAKPVAKKPPRPEAPLKPEELGSAAVVLRKAAAKKSKFEVPALPTEKVELPNLRAPLSPELEAELEAALGDQSLDEMIAAETSGATGTASGEPLEPEARLTGTVARIFRDNVFVDLGGRNQGVLTLHTLPQEPNVGDQIEVVVNRFNADDGLYELTPIGASVQVGDWTDIAEGITVEARITGHNKGGLECEVNKIRGFIPAGQISIYRVENFEEFVGQSWPCVVVEANQERRNLVLSRRAILEREQAEAKQQLLSQLEVGQVRDGTVRNIRDFGAFVDLGGIDGMIHVSQMSWDRIKHPSEVLTVGQKVKVKIQKIDPDTHKISLAYRDLFESPWTKVPAKYPVTSKVSGMVSRIMDFGAFVKLEPGVEGLVHISELSYKRVHRVTDVVQEGQQVEAKVLSVDPENQRISLSIKVLGPPPEPPKEKSVDAEAGESFVAATAPPAEPPKKKQRKVPLQGGLGRSPLGDKFGLKW
ncbi:MAG TPA: S1 RNA-binding domain-containing protein [Pirellulales bacterium]|nr:S1 RNA-binding domain-containing protein [Pirellulales bacterium]